MTGVQLDPDIARLVAQHHPAGVDQRDSEAGPVVAGEPDQTVPVGDRRDAPQPAVAAPAPASASQAPMTPMQRLGVVLTAIGVVCCSFVAYQLAATDLASARAQVLLRHELQERFTVERAVADTAASSEGAAGDSLAAFGVGDEADDPKEGAGGDVAPEVDEVERSIARPAPGAAIALLSIPAADVDHVVVEGTDHRQTATGPGHFRGSPLPGRSGNVVVIGRRTTHGAAFEHLGRLKRGDPVELSTGRGVFEYRVESLQVIRPGEADVLNQDGTNRLTLVTADQPFDASGRLVVTARPVGRNQPAPPSVDDAARLAVPANELGTGADPSAWGAVLLWGQLLILVLVGLRWLRRRWTPVSRWLVGAPLALMFGVLLFEALGRLLPATV